MKILSVNSYQNTYSNNSNAKNKSDIAFNAQVSTEIKSLLKIAPVKIEKSSTPAKHSKFLKEILEKIPLLEEITTDGLKIGVIPVSEIGYADKYFITISKNIDNKQTSIVTKNQPVTLPTFLSDLWYLFKGDSPKSISDNVNTTFEHKNSFFKKKYNK